MRAESGGEKACLGCGHLWDVDGPVSDTVAVFIRKLARPPKKKPQATRKQPLWQRSRGACKWEIVYNILGHTKLKQAESNLHQLYRGMFIYAVHNLLKSFISVAEIAFCSLNSPEQKTAINQPYG